MVENCLMGAGMMELFVKTYERDHETHQKDLSNVQAVKDRHLCFYRFIGGNEHDTVELVSELDDLKRKHQLLIGVFRFPFRFEGKKRSQTAAEQYFKMKELCDAVI